MYAAAGKGKGGAVGEAPSAALLGALGVGLFAALSPAARAWPAAAADWQPSACALALLVGASAASAVLRDRLLGATRNLLGHPLRSVVEWAVCVAATHLVHRACEHWSTRALASALAAALVLHASAELSALRARLALASQYRTFDLSRASFFADGAPLAPPSLPTVSLAELRAHASAEDCWIAIDGAVLDVSAWAKQHPGTALVITSLAGMDASDQYKAFHGYAMGARLRAMAVGRLDAASAEPPSAAQVAFRELHERLRARGEFAYPLGRTVLPMVRPFVLMALAIAAVVASARGLDLAGASPTALAALGGGLAGLAWQQMSLFGHDLGHGNVTGSYAHDLAVGLLMLPFFGIGLSWWKVNHNTHHVVTNSLTHDPDIQYLPIFAITPKMLSGFYSYYHRKTFGFDRAARALCTVQHWLYYPIMAVAKVNLYIQSHIFLFGSWMRTATPLLETLGLLCHYAAIGAALYALRDGAARAAFLGAAMGVAGILHVQITVSHFPMATYNGVSYADNGASWWHKQLAGTVDIDCGARSDWFHGGLQFQTIHHLYPRLPRFALRAVAREVDAACAQTGLVYNKTANFATANQLVLDTLVTTARAAKGAPLAEGPGAPLLWDAFNARG